MIRNSVVVVILICVVGFAATTVAPSAIAAPLIPPKTHPEPTPLDVPVPPGATHILIGGDDFDHKVKEVFTYFPYPQASQVGSIVPVNFSGVYRVEVNPEGKVTAVTILKTMGKRLDYLIMKTFLTWKGKPGPLRAVDITWFYHAGRAGGARSYH